MDGYCSTRTTRIRYEPWTVSSSSAKRWTSARTRTWDEEPHRAQSAAVATRRGGFLFWFLGKRCRIPTRFSRRRYDAPRKKSAHGGIEGWPSDHCSSPPSDHVTWSDIVTLQISESTSRPNMICGLVDSDICRVTVRTWKRWVTMSGVSTSVRV